MPRRGGVTDHNAAMNNKAETSMATHQGHCFCGAVEIEVNGAPEAMGYCHCNACGSAVKVGHRNGLAGFIAALRWITTGSGSR